jgi:RNA polymerase primary sigma factor
MAGRTKKEIKNGKTEAPALNVEETPITPVLIEEDEINEPEIDLSGEPTNEMLEEAEHLVDELMGGSVEAAPLPGAPATTKGAVTTYDAITDYYSDDSVASYLREIGRVPLLTFDQEKEFAKRLYVARLQRVRREFLSEKNREPIIEEVGRALQLVEKDSQLPREKRERLENDYQEAIMMTPIDEENPRNKLMEANLRLVVSIARKYSNRAGGLTLLDLIQEGNIGLMRAIEKYDYQLGYKFSTYATWWIRQSVTRAIADQGRLIRLPAHLNEQLARVQRIRRDLVVKLNREPSLEEMANELDMPLLRLERLLAASQEAVSLETPVGEEGEGTSLGDFIEDPNSLDPVAQAGVEAMKAAVAEALEKLTPREQQIIKLRYGLDEGGRPRTLEEVAKEFGITRERIRQIEAKVLRKLRHPRIGKVLRAFLDEQG